jgi:hypothetical protein
MSETNEKASYLWRLGRWMAELVLVFVGVYAAFWLNNYQQHLQEAKRRDQILASIEQTLRDGIESGKINGAQEEQQAAEFQLALDADEMPRLHSVCFHDRLHSDRPRHPASIRRHRAPRCRDAHRVAQRRIGYPLGAEPHGALSETQRRANRTESRPGHFLFLRSGRQEIAKTLRDVSRSSQCKGEICSRPRKNPHRASQKN